MHYQPYQNPEIEEGSEISCTRVVHDLGELCVLARSQDQHEVDRLREQAKTTDGVSIERYGSNFVVFSGEIGSVAMFRAHDRYQDIMRAINPGFILNSRGCAA